MSISISISTLVKRQKPNGAMASSCVVPVSLTPLRRLLFKHHLLPGARVGTVEQVTAPMASMGLNSHCQSLRPQGGSRAAFACAKANHERFWGRC